MISILYVDDEPELLGLCKIFLEQGGEFRVTPVASAQESLDLLSTTSYDAIISDYQMPDIDGLEFLKRVRSHDEDIPFILFTGRGREEVVIEAINNKVDFYLQKGGDPKAQFAELGHKVKKAVKSRDAINALRAENEKNRGLMDHASDAIFIADAGTGMLIDANRKAQHLIGRSLDEIKTMHQTDLHPPDKKDLFPDVFLQHAREGTAFQTEINAGHDGRHIPVIASATIMDLGGRCCFMEIFHDISDIKMAQDALQLANRKLNLLAEITRHDIRNKLTVMGGYLDLIRERPAESQHSMYVRKMKDTVSIIGENIEFTRLYQNLGIVAPAWQNVYEAFFNACTHVDIRKIRVQSDSDGFEIYADPLLERVFYNLVENAILHGSRVSMVRISARESPEGLILSLEDDGVGIPMPDKERVFTKGFGKNTGLGLFLVKEILSITNITIQETGEYQHGARFEMHIPKEMYRIARDSHRDRCHILTDDMMKVQVPH
ncbi:MAG: response regulator [Methanoregula sp.]|jgi:PAS domain S-box-containing protein